MKRVAIYGGSFDPIHTGHTMIASQVALLPGIDEVWLMVSPENPFKSGRRLAPESDRLAMTRLAVADIPGVEASDFEFALPHPSYTYNTLCRLREAYPDCEFSLVIGADNWRDFTAWRNHAEILSEFGLIIYPRPGIPLAGIDAEAAPPDGGTAPLVIPEGARITVVADAPQSESSSTEARKRLSAGRPTEGLLDPAVRAYIDSHALYPQSTC